MSSVSRLGRPGIGGEYLELRVDPDAPFYREVQIARFNQVASHRSEPRSLKVAPLPAGTMLFDLLEVVEMLIAHGRIDLDSYGQLGTGPTFRQRLSQLAKK